MRRIPLLMALLLALAACSQADEASDHPGAPEESAGSVDMLEMADTERTAVGEEGNQLDVRFDVPDERKVIRRARLHLHASDTRAAFDEIIRLTESTGGFVAQADVMPTTGEDDQPDVSMTLRVPAAELNEVMAAIKELVDDVVSESQGAEDVTEQYVDLEARLTNLEALEVELRALLEEVRRQPESDPEKLLTVFNELSSVRGQIEQIQGQINYLNDLTSLATLEVLISQTPSAAPIVAEPWQPLQVAKDAVRDLVASLQDVVNWAIGFALSTLPILILTLGIPGGVAYLIYRRIRARRDRTTPPTPAPAES